jgi:hypothetical protein
MDEEARRAAWAVYVSLHNLAASHVLGQVPTYVHDDSVSLGDLEDVLDQLNQHERVLWRSDPELVREVRDTVARWDYSPTTRLVRLLPMLDRLAGIAGTSLPPILPPT